MLQGFTSDPAVIHQCHVLWPWLAGMMPAAGWVFALDGVDCRPFARAGRAELGNAWGLPSDTVVPVKGGPHNIGWTHPEVVNKALLGFLAGTTPTA